ncbi:cell division protein PerM [Nocardioides terrisoli]|uniref:cell division protein PerM n=1 Tax=Nocardioides terrisoli TaxID=3388267 RepID=UPI00287B73F5|nr:DUF6350 family protein [Nocardioides marmorisolisilvae]
MTDLISRPRLSTGAGSAEQRPLVAAGALAAAVTVGATLVLCMAVAVIGWFLADAGAHGQTTDALRVGADAWLLGHGADLSAAGGPIGITPLGLTLMVLVVGYRSGRWAARNAEPARDDRSLATAVLVCAGVYVVLAVLVALLATRSGAEPSVPRAVLGGLVLPVVGCGLGLAQGTGRLTTWWQAVPDQVRSIVTGALSGAMLLVAAGAVLSAVSLVLSFNDTADLFSSLHLSFGDALMLLLASALVAPNAVLLATSWLAGPGFAVGTGTSVTATAVTLGPLPAFPLLAALPGPGSTPGWWGAFLAAPPLCALAGAVLVQRRRPVLAWDAAVLRGLGSGLGAGALVWLLAALAGGPMGTGRMADIGVPSAQLLVVAVGGMSLGGILGGVGASAWQRRAARRSGGQ